MSALEALHAARQAGVKIALDGDDLILEATAPPPEAVLSPSCRATRDRSYAATGALGPMIEASKPKDRIEHAYSARSARRRG